MKTWKVSELSPLALAYIGDAVWEMYVRNHVLSNGIRRPNDLHVHATRYVKADAQAKLVQRLWEQLSEEEQSVVRRGRNAKSGTVRKNADLLDYRHSTGFEALIGYLYGTGQQARLDELCSQALNSLDHERDESNAKK